MYAVRAKNGGARLVCFYDASNAALSLGGALVGRAGDNGGLACRRGSGCLGAPVGDLCATDKAVNGIQ